MSEKSRIRWLCRRGMKELDVLLERYMATAYDDLSESDSAAFEALLQSEDPQLYGLLMQRNEPANPAQARVLEGIRACVRPI